MSSVIVKRSRSPHAETMSSLVEAIERRGPTVFARIDHAGGARAVGLELADEQVVVFGSPRSGTAADGKRSADRNRASPADAGLA
jgi:uncharacterized protein (DUF302 family)